MEKKLQEEDPLLDDRVDINRAGKEELMTLTGVGETRAQAILAYRETHGSFSSVEELRNISGGDSGAAVLSETVAVGVLVV
mgnify:CR=1 FL=1